MPISSFPTSESLESFASQDNVEIVLYRPGLQAHRQAFKALNLAWIERYFGVEDEDRRVLEQPDENIIHSGGQILFAILTEASGNSRIVGTCALIPHRHVLPDGVAENVFELAKMAVDESAQGKKIGRRLLEAAIAYARSAGKSAIELESNTALKPAIALYEKLGFQRIAIPADTKFKRVDIAMRLLLG